RENEWGFGDGASSAPGASQKMYSVNFSGGGSDGQIGVNPGGIIKQADLTMAQTDSPDPLCAGNNLTYTLTITNEGPNQAQSLVVTDNLPSGTTFVSCNATGGAGASCGGSGNNRTVTFT